jgi:CheY-like chemotaxis protein
MIGARMRVLPEQRTLRGSSCVRMFARQSSEPEDHRMPKSAPVSSHLLVVEAEPSVQRIIQEALAGMGYVSTSASSFAQALRLLHQHPFDLVVTNVFSRSRQQALVSLRPLLALAHPLPVLLCTAWPLTETEVRHEGFAALVEHPFDVDHLVTTVAACLNQPWSPAQRRQAKVVQRFVASFALANVETMTSFFTEEVQLYPWIVSAYPFARPVRGRAAARDYLRELLGYFGVLQIELVQLYPCPEGIAVRLLVQWHDASGALKQQMLAACVKVTPHGQISQMGLPPPDERLLAQLGPLRGA